MYVWALPSHADPQAKKPDPDAGPDTNANENGKGQHQDEDNNAEEDSTNKAKVKDKIDLNQTKRSFTQVAAVGETKAGISNAEGQLCRRLSVLLATPIREYAIGFTLRGERLKVYVMSACGLSTFLYRLVQHSDRLQNGILETTTPLDDRIGPFMLCPDFFPPAASELIWGATTMSNFKIEKLLFRRQRECGRATSTYKITTGEGTICKTRATTIIWVEESRNSDLVEIRNVIQEKRPRGLAPLVGVFRTEYRTLPMFLPGDESLDNLTSRAREVVIHEECLLQPHSPRSRTRSSLHALSRVRLRLRNYGFIHRDVFYGNIMVDRHGDEILLDYNLAVKKARTAEEECCRLSHSGKLPYISKLLLSPATEGVVHERWHDIEFFFYVASLTAFQSEPADAPLSKNPDAADIWDAWNAQKFKVAAGKKG